MALIRRKAKAQLTVLSCLLMVSACTQTARTSIDSVRAAYARSQLTLAYIGIAEYSTAARHLSLALQHAPQHPATQLTAAIYYQTLAQYQQAENYYLAAIQQHPNNLAPLLLYVHFLCAQRRYTETRQPYQQMLESLTEPWLNYLQQLNQHCIAQDETNIQHWITPIEQLALSKLKPNNESIGLLDLLIEIILTSIKQ